MEPEYLAFWMWLYTPCSSSDKVIGSLGFVWISAKMLYPTKHPTFRQHPYNNRIWQTNPSTTSTTMWQIRGHRIGIRQLCHSRGGLLDKPWDRVDQQSLVVTKNPLDSFWKGRVSDGHYRHVYHVHVRIYLSTNIPFWIDVGWNYILYHLTLPQLLAIPQKQATIDPHTQVTVDHEIIYLPLPGTIQTSPLRVI